MKSDFSTMFLINSLASGVRPPPPNPPQMHISNIFYIFTQFFAKNSIQFLKIVEKSQNFL